MTNATTALFDESDLTNLNRVDDFGNPVLVNLHVVDDYQNQHENFLTELYEVLEGAEDIYAEVGMEAIYVEWFRYDQINQVSMKLTQEYSDFHYLAQATIQQVRKMNSEEVRIKQLLKQLNAIEVK